MYVRICFRLFFLLPHCLYRFVSFFIFAIKQKYKVKLEHVCILFRTNGLSSAVNVYEECVPGICSRMFTVMWKLTTQRNYDTLHFQKVNCGKYMAVSFSLIHSGVQSNCDIAIGFVFFPQTVAQCTREGWKKCKKRKKKKKKDIYWLSDMRKLFLEIIFWWNYSN